MLLSNNLLVVAHIFVYCYFQPKKINNVHAAAVGKYRRLQILSILCQHNVTSWYCVYRVAGNSSADEEQKLLKEE